MKRLLAKFGIDLCIWVLATPLAYVLRFDEAWSGYTDAVITVSLLVIPVKLAVMFYERSFLQSWHRVGLRDVFSIARGVAVYSAVFLVAAFLLRGELFIPRSVPVIEGMLLVLGLGTVRLSARLWYEYKFQRDPSFKRRAKRVLIAGAGEAGTLMAREMLRNPEAHMNPVGFLDDDRSKRKQSFLGLPVLGGLGDAREVIDHYAIDTLLIAMPSESGDAIRSIIEKARNTGVAYKIVPPYHEMISGKVGINTIRDVDVEDLLRREPVELNTEEIAGYLEGRTVLVTGAGGSIGSEIVRQILPFHPERLLLLDISEYNIYCMEQELDRMEEAPEYHAYVGDVRDRNMLWRLFEEHRPDVVFHAAAHKHVPLMERNPSQAILNNVGGTQNLVDLALEYSTDHFVNISSDKAVNPSSVMGASKRVAEYVVEWGSRRAESDRIFVSVRFGNVLGSSGSVIPKFKEQIRRREPITVTHKEMKRYFMTIPEASQLVLQAGGLTRSGAVYVLDMGEPVKIVDLARDLVRLSGLEPDVDIPITFTGIRPGEKLFEELLADGEHTDSTRYEKIHVAQQNGLPEDFNGRLEELMERARDHDTGGIRELLYRMIPVNELRDEKQTHE